jgi:hypothetical protein
MSFFSKIGKALKPALGILGMAAGGAVGGPVGAAVGGAIGGSFLTSSSAGAASLTAAPAAMSMMGSLPRIGSMLGLGGVAAAGGMVLARGRTIARAAGALCLKHPQWCSTIGGTAAIAALMESGQLPVPRRRRGRGLTPRDLRSFRRVASLVRGFCPTVRRIPSRAIRHVRPSGISHAA